MQENLKGIPVRQYGKNLKHLPFIYFSVFITPFRLKVIAHSSGAPGFTPGISGVRVTRSLVLCVCFVDRCLSFCTFSFGHYVVCSSSIYGFWLPLWYLQTLLKTSIYRSKTQRSINLIRKIWILITRIFKTQDVKIDSVLTFVNVEHGS